jgi:rhamnosyltransferase
MAMSAPTSIAALVVIYFPDTGLFERLQRIRVETGRLCVVDNGATPETRASLAAWAAANDAVVIANPFNLGQAAALNRGMAWAEEQGCDWVVTFDQDSTPQPGFAAALLASACRAKDEGARVAVVGAHIYDERTGRRGGWLRPAWHGFRGDHCEEADLAGVTFVITSGALTSVRAWRELGGFDEPLFIDFVDVDFCLRAQRSGWEIRVSRAARLAHNLGNGQEVTVAGRTFRATSYGAIRHYYIARNRVLMWRRHAWRFPHWCLFEFYYGSLNIVRVLLTEDQRKLRAMVVGTLDGCMGRTGPCQRQGLSDQPGGDDQHG